MVINYTKYKTNTYGFFRFEWSIGNNWEITSDTTTSTITITAKDSEENVYTFEKPWTFLIIKDGEEGKDGVSVNIGTDCAIIRLNDNNVLDNDTKIIIPWGVYLGETRVTPTSKTASKITVRQGPDASGKYTMKQISPSVTNTQITYTLPAGWYPYPHSSTITITIVYNEETFTQYIPYSVIRDGEKGDAGESGVYIGTDEPTDENINVWIDTDGSADGVVTDVQVNGTSVVNNGIANIPEIPTSLKYVKDDPSDDGGVVVGHVSENTASGWNAYAEGGGTTASATCSHAEGAGTRATGGQAHSEGGGTLASGNQAHAEGASTIASGDNSHAENLSTTASGACSHASGIGTIAQRKSQFVIGESNVAEIGGNTTSYTVNSHIIPLSVGVNTMEIDSNTLSIEYYATIERKSIYKNKTLSILGDSLSTFNGYLPEGNPHYYPLIDVQSVNDTWWMKLINALGMELNTNNSWSGAKVSGTATSAGSGNRATELGTSPDVIIIWMGANDFLNNVAIGNYDGKSAIPTSTNTFSDAYAVMLNKVLTTYPDAEVWVCTLHQFEYMNDDGFPETNNSGLTLKDYNDVILTLADAFGVRVLENHKCGMTYQNRSKWYSGKNPHPNKAGHSMIANNAIRQMDNYIRTRY